MGPCEEPGWANDVIALTADGGRLTYPKANPGCPLKRFVASVNAAGEDQHSPTVAVDPEGRVLCELPTGEEGARRIELDLDEVRSVYLQQRRTDLTGRGSFREPAGLPKLQ
jgi:hypothetical protein